jgi:hypothetical protein
VQSYGLDFNRSEGSVIPGFSNPIRVVAAKCDHCWEAVILLFREFPVGVRARKPVPYFSQK